ncbi:MAG: glycosyltransferase [Clostridia bacterium]|nr:glycosyltransferase [Clostridia bacterium]
MVTSSNWETLRTVIDTVVLGFQIALWGIFFYYLVISMFGWFKRKEVPASNYPIKNKFAVIVAAHNEEMVIGGIVRSLKQQNYPSHMYDIYVIADNCTDNTAAVARENGANVCERFDSEKKGKGYSLEWMFEKLFKMDKKYDAVCIFDADNLASTNFLLEMNKQLCMGHKVIQGYLDSKNPSDSWISGNYSISYWISNRLFQLPRHYLGLSCALGGTGFVMSAEVLKDIGWGATCLTEDLEFSLKLVMKGMRVSWSHEAVVYDEKPLRMKQSWKQRKRWMQGHCDCARRFLKDLLVKAFKERDKVAFDSCMYLIQPFVIVANGIGMIAGIAQFIKAAITNFGQLFTPATLLFALLIVVLTYVNIIFVFVEGKLTKKIATYFLSFPLYSLTWVPIIIHGFIDRNKREWVHTLHTRALDINDVESLEKAG